MSHDTIEESIFKRMQEMMEQEHEIETEALVQPTQKALRQLVELKKTIIELGHIILHYVESSRDLTNQISEAVEVRRKELPEIQNQLDNSTPNCILTQEIDNLMKQQDTRRDATQLKERDIAGIFDQIIRDAQVAVLTSVLATSTGDDGHWENADKGFKSLSRFKQALNKQYRLLTNT